MFKKLSGAVCCHRFVGEVVNALDILTEMVDGSTICQFLLLGQGQRSCHHGYYLAYFFGGYLEC